jgi:hypothetical protein
MLLFNIYLYLTFKMKLEIETNNTGCNSQNVTNPTSQILEIKIEFFLLIAPKVLGAIAKKQNPFSKINHIFYLSFTWRSFFWINWSSFHIYALKQNYRFTYLWSKGIQKSLSYRGCQFLPNYSLFS